MRVGMNVVVPVGVQLHEHQQSVGALAVLQSVRARLSKALLSAVELELFTQLGGESMTGEQIEQRLGRAFPSTRRGITTCA